MFNCVLFDLDGTLADSVESIAMAGNKALKSAGFVPRPVEEYKYYAGDGVDTLVERALKAAGDEKLTCYVRVLKKYREFFKTDCAYHIKPYDGICSLLEELKKRGTRIGVVSNKPHAQAVQVVEALFGKGFFDVIAGQKEGIPKKPDPGSVLKAAKELGCRAGDCIYAGDTNVDMETGQRAGMFTVGVLWGFRDEEELRRFHPQAIIKRPEELLQFL